MRRLWTLLYLRLIRPYVMADLLIARIGQPAVQENVLYVVHLNGGAAPAKMRDAAQPVAKPN